MPFHSMIAIPKASYNKSIKCNRVKLRQDNKKHEVNDMTTLFPKGIQRVCKVLEQVIHFNDYFQLFFAHSNRSTFLN